MDSAQVLLDGFARIRALVPQVVDGLSEDRLSRRPSAGANSMAWLVWHATRVLDDHVADVAQHGQVWVENGWAQRFGLELPETDTGYGHRAEDVAKVRAPAELLVGYYRATADMADHFVAGLTAADLDRVVDSNWNPPVTLGVRLVSVLSDGLQHLGQAAYLRGLQAD